MIALLMATLAAVQLPSAERVESAVKRTAGERRYVGKEDGKVVAVLTVKHTLEQQGGKAIVVLDTTIETTIDGPKRRSSRETASLDGLALLSKETTVRGERLSVQVVAGRAMVDVGGKKEEIEVTPITLGESTVPLLLESATQKEGTSFKVDVFAAMVPALQRDWEIRCTAKEQIEIGGRKMDAFRWETKREQREPRGPRVVTKREYTCWIDADGRILRIRVIDFEWELVIK